ncbi:hypothetical protein ACA910_013563 [Epithemia clementina (nom. ined.)]
MSTQQTGNDNEQDNVRKPPSSNHAPGSSNYLATAAAKDDSEDYNDDEIDKEEDDDEQDGAVGGGDHHDKKVAARRHLRDRRFSPDGSAPQMTKEQRERKRLINRMSAQRKRQRERYQLDTLTDQNTKFSLVNSTLAADNDRLEKLQEKVRTILVLHNTVNTQRQGSQGQLPQVVSPPLSSATKLNILELLRSAFMGCMASFQPSKLLEPWDPPEIATQTAGGARSTAGGEPNAAAGGEQGESPLVRTTRFLKDKLEQLDSASQSVVQESVREQQQQEEQQRMQQQQQQQQQQQAVVQGPNFPWLAQQQFHGPTAQVPTAQVPATLPSLLVPGSTNRTPNVNTMFGDSFKRSWETALITASTDPQKLAALQQSLMSIMQFIQSPSPSSNSPPPMPPASNYSYVPVGQAAGPNTSNTMQPASFPQISAPTNSAASTSTTPANNEHLTQLLAAAGSNPTPETMVLLQLVASLSQQQSSVRTPASSTPSTAQFPRPEELDSLLRYLAASAGGAGAPSNAAPQAAPGPSYQMQQQQQQTPQLPPSIPIGASVSASSDRDGSWGTHSQTVGQGQQSASPAPATNWNNSTAAITRPNTNTNIQGSALEPLVLQLLLQQQQQQQALQQQQQQQQQQHCNHQSSSNTGNVEQVAFASNQVNDLLQELLRSTRRQPDGSS